MAENVGDAGAGGGETLRRGVGRDHTGRLVLVDEDKYYTSLYEEYVAPRRHARTPEQEDIALYRVCRRLRLAAKWRRMRERKAFRPVAVPGSALRLALPADWPCRWCCCPFAPCPCSSSARPLLPRRRVPRGDRAPEERDPEPADAVTRLRRAARENCLCPLLQLGAGPDEDPTRAAILCPATQLDFDCKRGVPTEFEVRRQAAMLAASMARHNGKWKEVFQREPLGRYGQMSVGTQTWENSDGTMYVGSGTVLQGRAALFGRRQQLREARRLEARARARGDADAGPPCACRAPEDSARDFEPASSAERLFDILDGGRVDVQIIKDPNTGDHCKKKN